MRIAIISDTHFGIRNDSPIFLNYSLNYFENVFFPYLIENNIKHVIHMGDLLDRRKYVNFNTLAQVRTKFMNKFDEYGITLHITLGNHDVFFKNSNEINSIKELFSYGYSNIKIYENLFYSQHQQKITDIVSQDNEYFYVFASNGNGPRRLYRSW